MNRERLIYNQLITTNQAFIMASNQNDICQTWVKSIC